MTRLASARQNAFAGLRSLSSAFGIDGGESERMTRDLRLVRSGILEIGDAATSTKNLLSSGFNLEESRQILEAFSDTAAFGKSQALSFGEAIRSASEGIRNGNSVLVDNVGLTKNLSAILKDAGFQEKDLSRVKEDHNVRQALFNGLLREALPQMGDADKLTRTWTGSTAALSAAKNNLYAEIGNIIISNKELLALTRTLTGDIDDQTRSIQNNENGWRDSINAMSGTFAEFVMNVSIGVRQEIADIRELVNIIETAAYGLSALSTDFGSGWTDTGAIRLKEYQDRKAKIGSYSSAAEKDARALRDSYNRNLVIGMGLVPGYNPLTQRPVAPLGASLNRPHMNDLIDLSTGRPGNASRTTTTNRLDTAGATKKSLRVNTDDVTRELQDAIDLALALGFKKITSGSERSTAHDGKGHYAGRALDLSIRDAAGNFVFDKAEFARKKLIGMGYNVPELKHGSAPHLHVEVPKGGRRNAVTGDEIDRYNSMLSDSLTSDREKADLNDAITFALANGTRPDDATLSAYHQQQIEQARKAGTLQPKEVETFGRFAGLSEMGRERGYQPTYLQDKARELEELIKLNDRRSLSADSEEEKYIAAESYRETTRATIIDLETERYVLESVSDIDEIRVEYARQRNDQVRDLNAAVTGLGVLEQQNADAEFVNNRRVLEVKEEQLELEKQIGQLGDRIANSGQNDYLKLTVALLEKQLSIKNEELDATIAIKTAEMDINRMLEIRGTSIQARVYEHLAQQKSMTDSIADGIIGIYEGIAGPMEQGIDKLTQKLGIFSGLFGGILKTTGRGVLTSLTRGVFDSIGLGNVFDKSQESSNPVLAGLEKQDKQIDLLTQIAMNTGGGAAVGLPSLGGSGGLGGFRMPGIFGGGGGGGFGGFGGFGTPSFNPSGGGSNNPFSALLGSLFGGGGNRTGSISTLPNGEQAYNVNGRGSGLKGLLGMFTGGKGMSGLTGMLGGMLPGLGLSLGAGLGQGSLFGTIAGGAGGLLLGGAGAVGLLGTAAGSIFGAGGALAGLVPFLTNPFTIAAGAALIPLAIILSINAKRRKAEKERTAIKGSAITELDKLIGAVRGRRMSGDDALAQAEQIKTQYTDEISKLKDAKTRRIAMNEWNKPNALWLKMEEIKKEAEVSRASDDRDRRIVPEFADGGWHRAKRGGQIVRVGEGGYDELTLSSDPSKAARTAQLLSGFISNYAPAVSSASSMSQGRPITFIVQNSIDPITGTIRTAISTDSGIQRELIKVVNDGVKNHEVRIS